MTRFHGHKKLPILFFPFIFVGIAAAEPTDPRLLSLVPPGAQVLAGISAPPIQGQPDNFVLVTHFNTVDLEDFYALTGADTTRIIHQIVFVAPANSRGPLSEHSLLASGHFDQSRLFKSATEGGAAVMSYRRIPVLEIQPFAREHDTFNEVRWLAVLDSNVLVFGSTFMVQMELDRYLGLSQTEVSAETHCPGNVDSLPLRFVNHHQMIVAVSVNHSGPYNFLLDTGTQATLVDPSLVAELHLEPAGGAVVAGVQSRQAAPYAYLDLLEAGSHAIANQRIFVYNLQNLRSAVDIRGVLGEDFLEHFDVLIDNVHKLLCLDRSGAMRADVRGPHIALVSQSEITGGSELPNPIVIEARLSDATRPVRLMLDSGANGAILYNTSGYLAQPQTGHLQGTSVDGRGLMFSALPLQDVKIGSLRLPGVPFVSFAQTQKDAHAKGFDGVLTLGLFRRVFIAPADHFAILEPR